jgi:hypothetical protein
MLTAELAKTDLLSGSILFLGYLFAACRYAGQTSMLGRQWRHRRIRDRVRAECYRSGIHPVQLPRISGWRATSRGCGRRFRRQSLRRHDRRGRISVRWRFGYGSSGCGTVFKLTSTGKETLLYSFAQALTPRGDLFRDAFGNLGSHDTSNGSEKSLMVVRPLAGATPVVPPVAIPVLPAAVPTEVLVYEGFTVAVGK